MWSRMDTVPHDMPATISMPGALPRIGIDGFNLAMARGTGVATYGRVLSHCLVEMGHKVDVLFGMPMSHRASPLMREVTFFNNMDGGDERPKPAALTRRWWREMLRAPFGLQATEVPITGKVEARTFRSRMPSFDRILNVPDLFSLAGRHFRRTGQFLRVSIPNPPALMHWTYPVPVRLAGARNVYTVHDMVPLRLPYATLDDKGYHMRLMRGCLRYGDRICTVSDASLRDIVSLFPKAEGRVVNTYEAVDPAEAALAMPEGELARMLMGVFELRLREYFLFFGSIEPKKNVGRLIEAYLASGCETPLILVGARAWKSEREARLLNEIAARPRSKGQPPRVRQIEYLPFAMLMNLIRGAKAVAFPSLSEGFGLPVVEAMALGTPVLTTMEGSLPEIAGEAALLVDAYDTDSIAAGLRRLESEPALREWMSVNGRVQAELFGREAYKARIADLYRDVLTSRRGA